MVTCTSTLVYKVVGTKWTQLIVKYIIRQYDIDVNENVKSKTIQPIECTLKSGHQI